MSSGVGRLLAGVVGAAVSWAAVAAYAQPVAPSRQEVNPEQGVAARARERSVDMFSAPVEQDCPLKESSLTFTLRTVTVLNSETGARAAAAAFKDLAGREMKVAEICEIRDRLANLLYRQGILARVLIPEQTIADGELKLEVIEGRIVGVRVHGDASNGPGKIEVGRAQDKVEDYIEQLRNLTPFDIDTAYRYIWLANSVPGVHVTASLIPSSAVGVRGAIDLDVTVARDPAEFLAAVQNHGSDSLGPWGLLARANLNSFTKYGERTSLIAYRTVTDNEQWIVQLVEEARFGDSGLVGKASVAYGKSKPGGVLKPLGLVGKSKVATLEARYPLIVRRQDRATTVLFAAAGIDAVNQFTGFPGGGALADDKLRVFWLALDGDYTLGLGERMQLAASGKVEARKGFSWLGASKAGASNLSRFEGKPDAWTVRFEGEAHLTHHYDRLGASDLGLKLQAQYADDPLLSYEEMAVGDLTIGKGYEPAVLSGDRVVSAELRAGHSFAIRKVLDKQRLTLTPFVFADISRIQNLDIGSESRTLRSAGAGIGAELGRGPFGTRILGSLAWAHPFDKPFPTAPNSPSDRLLVQIVISR